MPANAASSVLKLQSKKLVPIIPYDIKLIQYKYSIYKLQEILRILNVLEKNLSGQRSKDETSVDATNDDKEVNDSSAKNNTIIPLLNYILCLCEGHIFNISPLMRRRFELLCQCKHCKLQELNPPLSITTIDLLINFHHVTINDFEHLKGIIYDVETQWRLLHSLKTISNNALLIYNKRLRQLQLERASNSHRPYEITETHSTFNVNVVEDLIRPTELSLALDFAVLINDKDKDTSLTSFLKLQWQVMNKFISFIQKKILPQIKQYYNQLNKYSNQTTTHLNEPIVITNFEFTFHRIYALTLKIYNLLTITICITRQIYLPNKNYFQNLKVKLIAENVYEYENIIKKIDDICLKSIDGSFNEFYQQLEKFIDLKHLGDVEYICKNKKTIVAELYKDIVQKNVKLMRSYLHSIESWTKIWKFIKTNTGAIEKFSQYDTEQLIKLVDERRAVDKLAFIEKTNRLKTKNNESVASSDFSTASSSIPTSPSNGKDKNDVKLTNVGAKEQHSSLMKLKIFNSPTSLSPISNSRRSSVDRTNIGKNNNPVRGLTRSNINGSGSNSPLASRRASVIDRMSSIRPLISLEQSSPTSSNSATPTKQPVSPSITSPLKRNLTVKNRKRSSSLQSPQIKSINATSSSSNGPNTNIYKSLPTELKRSNSLETNDALNQKLVQDTMKKLMSSNLSAHITDPDGALKNKTRSGSSSATLTRSRSSSVTSSNNYENNVNDKSINTKAINNVEKAGKNKANVDSFCENAPLEKLTLNITIESDLEMETITADVIKKVRFVGVPPMTAAEDPKPKRKGWYKKPAVLRYPPIPSNLNIAIRSKFNQEGIAFRSSLRDNITNNENKSSFALMNEESKSTAHRLGFLRDKFK